MINLKGAPAEIGRAYSEQCRDGIMFNLKVLVFREGYSPLPRQDKDFQDWTRGQESIVGKHWPWLLEEMHGVAQGLGVKYEDILLLNLRAWQFEYYGAKPKMGACSSLAITLADGTVASAGALDDPLEYYCGPVHVQPKSGYAFITFPLSGASWATRGQNSKGLSIGISSQILPGLRRLDHAVNQDLACRAILQTCATANEVCEFCRAHPFTLNLVVVDAKGKIFCAQNTAAGLLEMPAEGWCALTNHVADSRLRQRLQEQGVTEFPESPTTVPRLEGLQNFAKARSGKCTLAEVMDFIGRRDDNNPGTVHNKGSIYLTASNPQAAPNTYWIRQPKAAGHNTEFESYSIDA